MDRQLCWQCIISLCNHQGGTRSLRCLQETKRFLFWACPRLASLRAVYIPRVVNRAANVLSWTGPNLHTEVVHLIWAQFRRAHTDLFASAETTHCKIWFSLNGQGGLLGLVTLGSTILLSATKQRCKEGGAYSLLNLVSCSNLGFLKYRLIDIVMLCHFQIQVHKRTNLTMTSMPTRSFAT